MIFITVGTQLKFDRLIRTIDEWAHNRNGLDIFGQIGDPGREGYYPLNFQWRRFLEPSECDQLIAKSTLVVAHAGMGSIIGALSHCTPIVIMPRRKHLGEHRTDHQLGTLRRFTGRSGIIPAIDENELVHVLERETTTATGPAIDALIPDADPSLIQTIRDFINQDAAPARPDGRLRNLSFKSVAATLRAKGRWWASPSGP